MTENEFNLKCDKCSLIPNFTLYNYIDDCIKLNMICKEYHSFTSSLNNYIKKINNKNLNIKNCSECKMKKEKNEMNLCVFCKTLFCEKCVKNHFIIYHIFKNDILNEFSDKNIFKDEEEINQIKELMNKSVNYLKEINDYFKEIVNLFEDFMINNLNEILLIKMLYEDYIKMKKINIENSKEIYENIIFLLSLNELKLDKRNFDEFLKNKNNYIINGNKYKGNIIDGKGEMDYFIGKYEGKGKIIIFNDGIYKGILKDSKKECINGKMIYNNGDKFEGEFKNEIKEGKGKMIYKNGDIYEGEFKNDKREGNGKMNYKNRDIYEGEYKNDEREGNGKMIYKNGDIYEGKYKNDKREGNGKMIYKNGDIYEGDDIGKWELR